MLTLRINCDVLQDLYPNFIDGICSDQSKLLVEEHLKECESCRELIKDMARDMEEIKLEEGPEDKLSKKIILKAAGKKYFMVFMVALLFFLTGFYNIFTSGFNINLYISPEKALRGHTRIISHRIDSAEIVYMEEMGNNLYTYIFEDSTGFGVGMVKKRLGGLLWSSRENSGLGIEYFAGRPFYHDLVYNHEAEVIPYVVKVFDPKIKYVVLDSENELMEAIFEEGLITMEAVQRNPERFFAITEVENGYAIFYQPLEKVMRLYPRAFTKDGEEIHQVEYRIIQDGGVQGE